MPYPIKNLIEGRKEPVCAFPTDSAQKAFEEMVKNDFSQLPVVNESKVALGMVTYESILRAMNHFKVKVDQLKVVDAMVKAPQFSPDDDLFEVLDRLRDTNAVLIVDNEKTLLSILTSYDSTEYFRRRSEDMMLVEDIEGTIKDLILSAYMDKNGETDTVKLEHAIEEITSSKRDLKANYGRALNKYVKLSGAKVEINQKILEESFLEIKPKEAVREFDQLTLNEYISLLLSDERWDFYKPTLDIDSNALRTLLEEVRDMRNMLAHFRGEITPTQRDQLKFCYEWLKRHQMPIPVTWPSFIQVKAGETLSVGESSEVYLTGSAQTQEITPIDEILSPHESRYTPLAIWLQSRPGSEDRIQLTFGEIEELIGGQLPDSARIHRAWWANDAVGHSHSQLWLDSGWRATYINLTEEKVTFARIVEREKAYIRFFSTLLKQFRQHADFSIRDVSPGGQSWVVVQSLPENGPQLSIFVFAFTRGRRFRVEFYIDTWEKDRNKTVFDQLFQQRNAIEADLGELLTWERIDDKRACRIALYHEGQIGDPEPKQVVLREWAVERMIRFFHALKEPASKALEQRV